MKPTSEYTPRAEQGLPPWRYECVGDSDGEQVGYDHMVYDASGEEMFNAPNERVGILAAAAPLMLEALVWLMDATTPAEGVEQPAELKKARQRAMDAIRAVASIPKITPAVAPQESDSVGSLFAVWNQRQTEEEDARKMRDFFQMVYAQRNANARRLAEIIAGKILTDHPSDTEHRRPVWATIGGRLFLVRREGNDRDGWRNILDEQETPAAY